MTSLLFVCLAHGQDPPYSDAPSDAPSAPSDAPSAPSDARSEPAAAFSAAASSAAAFSTAELAAFEAALAADTLPTATPAPPRGAMNFQSLNPDMAFIGDVAFAYFTADAPRMAGAHDPNASGFSLQQLELSVSKSVDPYFRFDSNIVFSLFGVEIEEAYATTLALPGRLQVRVGQFLTRFGRANATHLHTWDFVDQPIALGRVFGGEGNRGLGVEASWLAPTPWYVEIVGSGTSAGGEGTARSFYGGEDPGFDTPLDLQGTLAIKQFFPLSDDWSLAWGLSVAAGPNPSGMRALGIPNRTGVYGTDVYLKWRPISRESAQIVALQTEWFYRRRQVPDDVWADLTGYAQASWRFSSRWGTAARWELGTPARTRDGEVAADTLDPEWTANRHRAAAQLTYWPSEFSRLRLEGEADLAGWDDTADFAAVFAFEFNVGAHGAHTF